MSLAALPYADPGRPEVGSPGRFLIWIAGRQRASLGLGMLWGTLWMLAQGAVPAALGAAVGAAAAGDGGRTAEAALVVLALGAVQTAAGVLRHRMAVLNWVGSASRTQQLVVRQATRLGADLSSEVATGEVVAVSSSDVEKIGSAFDVTARFAGAVVAFVAVLVLLVRSSPVLAVLTLAGAVVLAASLGPLLGPLERRERRQRERVGAASALAADTVAGLRVLRGVGGEEVFVRRYQQASQEVRSAAVRVAQVRSILDALQILLPGLLLVAVTWVGALQVQAGSLGVGELVAFYAYAVFLVIPLGTFTEVAQKWTSAYVSARRIVAVLGLVRPTADPAVPARVPDAGDVPLYDPATGLVVQPGLITGVVCADPETGPVLADRLGGDGPGGDATRLGDVALGEVARDTRRALVLVQDAYPALLSGTLAEHLDVPSSGRVGIEEAVRAAAAEDVLEAVLDADPTAHDVLSARITERGRSLSGGQRQRLALVRSLLADPAVLVLDEPTSAVDAHTEARIGDALRDVRRGRTTVLVTGSPLLLDRCDEVVLVAGGRAVAVGRHRDLMRDTPAYRAVVTRQEMSA